MDISEFSLAWRWTNEQYTVLPADVLAQIVPQVHEIATALFNESLTLTGDNGLSPAFFNLTQMTTENVSPSEITAWLLEHHSNAQTQVYLSWQPDTAVITNWGIFAKYWSDFCYPASDDLIVLPTDRSWALLYHHSEFVQHGVRL